MESGPHIARVYRINVPEKYVYFSATHCSDTLVVMSYRQIRAIPNGDNSVRVHRLRGDQLEELARIKLRRPQELLWLADRLLVADFDIEKKLHAVIEIEVSDTRLERRCELITRDACFSTFGGFIRFKRFKRLKLCFKRIIANYNFLK